MSVNSKRSVVLTDHHVAHLSSLDFVPYRDIQPGCGQVVIQRVMLNHGSTTTPLGDKVDVVLRELSRLGRHQFSSYSPSMTMGSNASS